jgi:16S rRNA processing protein RimM
MQPPATRKIRPQASTVEIDRTFFMTESTEQTPEIPSDPTEWQVLAGRVKGTWDKAFLRLIPYNDVPGRFDIGTRFAVHKPKPQLLQIKAWRLKDNAIIVDVGLETTAEANALVGQEIFIHGSMRPPLPEDEFYLDEALGMRVVLEDGEELGEIEEIIETSAHDVYVTPRAMIPVVPEFIIEQDFEKRVVTVRRWEGLVSE